MMGLEVQQSRQQELEWSWERRPVAAEAWALELSWEKLAVARVRLRAMLCNARRLIRCGALQASKPGKNNSRYRLNHLAGQSCELCRAPFKFKRPTPGRPVACTPPSLTDDVPLTQAAAAAAACCLRAADQRREQKRRTQNRAAVPDHSCTVHQPDVQAPRMAYVEREMCRVDNAVDRVACKLNSSEWQGQDRHTCGLGGGGRTEGKETKIKRQK